MTRSVLKGLAALPAEFESFDRPDPLTELELEVLRLMAGGYSNRELAEALGVTEGTSRTTSPRSSRRWGCATGHARC